MNMNESDLEKSRNNLVLLFLNSLKLLALDCALPVRFAKKVLRAVSSFVTSVPSNRNPYFLILVSKVSSIAHGGKPTLISSVKAFLKPSESLIKSVRSSIFDSSSFGLNLSSTKISYHSNAVGIFTLQVDLLSWSNLRVFLHEKAWGAAAFFVL